MRVVKDMKDVQIVLKDILDRLDKNELKDSDNRGLRITNLGEATADSDAVTLGQVKKLIQDAKL